MDGRKNGGRDERKDMEGFLHEARFWLGCYDCVQGNDYSSPIAS